MKRFIRTLAIMLVLVIVSSLFLVGCGSDSDSKDTASETSAAAKTSAQASETPSVLDKEATISFTNFMASGDNAKYLTAMIEEFNKIYPKITVKSENVGWDAYFTGMQTRIAAGNAPDVYELNYEHFIGYATQGVLADVSPYFESSKFDASVVNEAALKAFQYDGKQLGLPETFSNVLLIYNKDLFDKAGVAYPTKDWTWADEQAAAEKIRALGKDIYGINHPIQTSEFFKTVQQNGGSLLSADKKKFTINTPENVATLQAMVDRVVKTNVMPTTKQLGAAGDWQLFESGRLGMIVTGVWAFPEFTRECKFKWDVQVEPGNTKKATHFFSNGLVLNKDTKLGAQAFEFAKFMSSSKEAAKIRVDAGWELPPVTYTDIIDQYKKVTPPENKQAVFDSLEYLVTPLVIDNYSEFEGILNQHLWAARDGAKTPQKALDDAQKELEAKITLK